MTKLTDPINDYNKLSSLAATITMGTSTVGDTDLASSLAKFAASLPVNGDGSSTSSPINYVILITDGLTDQVSSSCTSSSCVYAMASSECTAIKQKSTLGVIYTTYLPIYQNNKSPTYETLYSTLRVYNYVPTTLVSNLTACASTTDMYFEAQDGPSITTQMQALFTKTAPGAARLTQ